MSDASNGPSRPFRAAVLRGLGYFMPPLLTVVIFFWLAGTVQQYVLEPVHYLAEKTIAWSVRDVQWGDHLANEHEIIDGRSYTRMSDDAYVPTEVYTTVRRFDGEDVASRLTANGIYERFVAVTYLKPYVVIPVFLLGFVLVLYLLGKLMTGRLGSFLWSTFERSVRRVPFVRNVYSSVKQVTDFVFNQRKFDYTRVVAIEYPTKNIWALAFITGEGLKDISNVEGDTVLSCLVPTSPMPVTGFTCMVPRRDVLELNITVDQALEYIISCGVVVPPHRLSEMAGAGARSQVGGRVLSEETAAGERPRAE
jgi:uncharacterized membrane protein